MKVYLFCSITVDGYVGRINWFSVEPLSTVECDRLTIRKPTAREHINAGRNEKMCLVTNTMYDAVLVLC